MGGVGPRSVSSLGLSRSQPSQKSPLMLLRGWGMVGREGNPAGDTQWGERDMWGAATAVLSPLQ